MVIIDEYTPNAQSLIDIVWPEQTAEYVMYFDMVLAGEQRNKQFVITEQEYDKWAEQCIRQRRNRAFGRKFSGELSLRFDKI